ncbi:MAG TPA: GT4 family glycosyltransferase PelF [Polyangiaceae bacterium]|nr:GT4 family glycosyltransferase PelF [Polyangiaceae bacterium]
MSRADVCLLLEGTYPFVRGGVSSWVHQIISGLPELTFSLVFIGSRRADYAEQKYTLPKNVAHLETHYLEDAYAGLDPQPRHVSQRRLEPSVALHEWLKARSTRCPLAASEERRLEQAVDDVLTTLETRDGVSAAEFLFGSGSWELIRKQHLEGDPTASFIDYFWTIRILHGPMFQLARMARSIPDAAAYHAVSTGYAGLLGALLERQRRRPFILTEHGIYTKERRIDLNRAEWLDRLGPPGTRSPDAGGPLRKLWIRCFESLGRLAYRSANPILSLYAGNQQRQVDDGADPARTRIIVNGIDTRRFESARAARPASTPRVIGLIGRIVPIKDVKTFVRTMGVVCHELPDVEGWIIGSADEDSSYDVECRLLVDSLGLGERVKFLGHQNVAEILPKLGLLMLTSISEAQPLAILEALAAGVPCVATDVGACREQIEGTTDDDRALGRAGRVVPFADHRALARAAVELLTEPDTWAACQRVGVERVARYYDDTRMLASYRSVYRDALGEAWPA